MNFIGTFVYTSSASAPFFFLRDSATRCTHIVPYVLSVPWHGMCRRFLKLKNTWHGTKNKPS